jgi:hypothetical protein
VTFTDALQLILLSVCTGCGLELSKELMHTLKDWVSNFRKKVKVKT